ncbi:MAG: adenylate/guanylate cyclase domain-containing protein [Bacillota bacterium]|nr:adenylate/guanylate cyclase domain-containing protein [Bacillota bacterium]
MADHMEFIRESIIRDMSEGVMIIGMDGMIAYVNGAAAAILDRKAEELTGRKFISCFFDSEENDEFNQTILDAVYDASVSHRRIVAYAAGQEIRHLHVTTSYLHKEEEKVGVIVVLSDISELTELRDAVKAMEQIKRLNQQLELRNKLLSETFGRFLSDEIVRQLLETPDGLALGGKKRFLTVMMSDLRGFTAISERMEPVSLISMLNHYLGEMTEIIQRRNGTIIEFIGDGILAIFGAPLPSEQHASDAVAAAVEMQMKMQEINEWNEAHGYPQLEMGIGINTGEVIVGNIGSEKRTKYGVVGSHVNLCGRIESNTVGGQILISPQTRERISEPLQIMQEQMIFPKGAKEPMQLAHITGIGGAYNLFCEMKEHPLRRLEEPLPVSYYVIRNKNVDQEKGEGIFLSLSETGAMLQTERMLQQYDDLQIDAGGKLFAKVVALEEEGWRLRFTSVPAEFRKYI